MNKRQRKKYKEKMSLLEVEHIFTYKELREYHRGFFESCSKIGRPKERRRAYRWWVRY